MSGIGPLDGVHRERPDGIYAKLTGRSFLRRLLARLCNTSNGRRFGGHERLLAIWRMELRSTGAGRSAPND
jgi:hypothetical protein